jgi:Fic-DOC domain mobile mystery protein B
VDEKEVKDASTAISLEDAAALKPNLATQRELDQWEYKNTLAGRAWALNSRRLKRMDPLTEPYIRELHLRMFNETWRWAGKYRTRNPNLGVPHHEIRDRLGQLLGDARHWLENGIYDLDEIAVRVHHQVVFIHPFPNGNGRHTRLLADVIVARGGRVPFSWGPDNLVAAGAARDEYIKALKQADLGDTQGLLKFARS